MNSAPDDQSEQSDEGGQVSEVSGMGKAGTPVSPGDSVAGSPSDESGRTDEGPTGPEAVTNSQRQDKYPRPNVDDDLDEASTDPTGT